MFALSRENKRTKTSCVQKRCAALVNWTDGQPEADDHTSVGGEGAHATEKTGGGRARRVDHKKNRAAIFTGWTKGWG